MAAGSFSGQSSITIPGDTGDDFLQRFDNGKIQNTIGTGMSFRTLGLSSGLGPQESAANSGLEWSKIRSSMHFVWTIVASYANMLTFCLSILKTPWMTIAIMLAQQSFLRTPWAQWLGTNSTNATAPTVILR